MKSAFVQIIIPNSRVLNGNEGEFNSIANSGVSLFFFIAIPFVDAQKERQKCAHFEKAFAHAEKKEGRI